MTQEVMSPPAFPCLIDSIQSLYYELMVGGSNTRDRAEKFSASDGQIACQDPIPLTKRKRGRYDLQTVSFCPSKKAPKIAAIEPSQGGYIASFRIVKATVYTPHKSSSSFLYRLRTSNVNVEIVLK
jgi:hypothetical protein